ncbi:MAG: hypothetical protein ACOY4L_12845 [Pseudomonadota bacterium]
MALGKKQMMFAQTKSSLILVLPKEIEMSMNLKLMAAVVAGMLVLSGCGKKEEPAEAPAATESPAAEAMSPAEAPAAEAPAAEAPAADAASPAADAASPAGDAAATGATESPAAAQ